MEEQILRQVFEKWDAQTLNDLLVYLLGEDPQNVQAQMLRTILSILQEREGLTDPKKQKSPENTCQNPEIVLE